MLPIPSDLVPIKYTLKISRETFTFVDDKGEMGKCKEVTVTAPKGRMNSWKVNVETLKNEENWLLFKSHVIDQWVYYNIGGKTNGKP